MSSFYRFLTILLCLVKLLKRVELTPIVGGHFVKTVGAVPKYPYMVSLQEVRSAANSAYFQTETTITSEAGNVYQHFCGGSLINSKWILTAAHCVWIKNVTQITAVIGYENISVVPELEHHAIKRVEYIYFEPNSYQNDIALLRLAEPYLKPMAGLKLHRGSFDFGKLPKLGMKANRKIPCKIIGYGATRHAGAIQENLIEGEVSVITKKKCRNILGYIWAPQSGENTICALGNDQDTCQGDSGGPLICTYEGQDYIYGIVSHGLTCGISGIPSIYTVTIPYVEWIDLCIHD